MKQENSYFHSRIRSFGYAFKGISTLLRSQANAQIHFVATVLVVGMGFILEVSRGEWILLVLAIAGVWVAEAFNTALEFLTDLVSPDPHPLAGKAKDVAAGGVLIMALLAAVAGGLIFVPRIVALF